MLYYDPEYKRQLDEFLKNDFPSEFENGYFKFDISDNPEDNYFIFKITKN